ncbi:MAG: DNA/RNA nuclease SfsA [Acidiferrobacterales bacterium]|nr:DNA/RNA nuclease SfsA [Acidiferrobacterales bacterium]
MKLPDLTEGIILSRYKRFLADIELDSGEVVTAHCANTGAMTSCWKPGARVALSYNDNPKRKLRWSLERVDMGQGWIGVNTARTNPIIVNFIKQRQIPGLTQYEEIQTEPVYIAPGFPKSRFDVRLGSDDEKPCYVEIKNTTLWLDQKIQFPDAVTERGRKHLELLIHAVQDGYRGIILFAVNRPEGINVTAASEIDPAYAETLRRAADSGVETIAVRIRHLADRVEMDGMLPVCL